MSQEAAPAPFSNLSPPKPSPPPHNVAAAAGPVDELVEEVLLRLPPEDPACLVRASAVCKPWRRILATPRFRRRYRQFHGTPPVLGLLHKDGRLVPTAPLPRALPERPQWKSLDCRHGRALFVTYTRYPASLPPFYFAVVDPLTGQQRRVPSPYAAVLSFSAGVLCAAQGCDHHGCEQGHFLVAVVTTSQGQSRTSGRLYSSATRAWSELTSVYHPNVKCSSHSAEPSVLVGDALYFNGDAIIKCQLGTCHLSVFETPMDGNGALMKTEDGGMGFAAVVDATNLTMWSRETGPEGAMGWAKLRVIDLKKLLRDGPKIVGWHSLLWWIPTGKLSGAYLSGFAEGTQVIFVSTDAGFYMADLKSRRARKVSCDSQGKTCFPYMNFYIPVMEAGLRARGNGLMFGKLKLL